MEIKRAKKYTYEDLRNIRERINILYHVGKFDKAKALIPFALEIAKQFDHHSEDFRVEIKKIYGLAAEVSAELGNFEQALQYYKSFQCLIMQLKTNFQLNETIKLYQFRKFTNYTLANLLNKEITLSRPNQMNDIVDSLVFTWLESPCFGATAKHKGHLDPYKESFRDYRIASFCGDNPDESQYAIQNTLMWSHYADEHRGFCVEYVFHRDDYRKDNFKELTVSRLFKIKYRNLAEPINFTEQNASVPFTTEEAFITKSQDWGYENEYRLLQYKPKQGELREQYKLSENTKIVAIYFGHRCLDSDIQIVKSLLKHTDIKFYKMKIDYADVYRLKYNAI